MNTGKHKYTMRHSKRYDTIALTIDLTTGCIILKDGKLIEGKLDDNKNFIEFVDKNGFKVHYRLDGASLFLKDREGVQEGILFPDGEFYEGEIKYGRRHGKGKQINAEGVVIH